MSRRSSLHVGGTIGSGGRATRLLGSEIRLLLPEAHCELAYDLNGKTASAKLNLYKRQVRQHYRNTASRGAITAGAALDLVASMRNLRDHARLFDNTYAALRGKLAIGGHIVDRGAPRIKLRGGVSATADLLDIKTPDWSSVPTARTKDMQDQVEAHGEMVFEGHEPGSSVALGLRGKRTVFGQQLASLVIPGVLEVPLRTAPMHPRATTELYGRVSAADATFEVALDLNTGYMGVSFGTQM